MSWLAKISQIDPEDLLFHGTGEPIEGPLRAGGYDGILWTAETSDVAQNYIPASGASMLLSIPSYRMNDIFTPNKGTNYDILLQMGYEPEVEWDATGRAQSWSIRGVQHFPKYRDVKQFLEQLGYQPEQGSDGTYWVKDKMENDHQMILPADFKMEGTLFILIGRKKLKIYDLTHTEADLNNPQYHWKELFNKLKAEGYDGVRINDWAQSKQWGNVGHRSIGIFPSGLAKLQVESISAKNFDWGEKLNIVNTPEFEEWQSRMNTQ